MTNILSKIVLATTTYSCSTSPHNNLKVNDVHRSVFGLPSLVLIIKWHHKKSVLSLRVFFFLLFFLLFNCKLSFVRVKELHFFYSVFSWEIVVLVRIMTVVGNTVHCAVCRRKLLENSSVKDRAHVLTVIVELRMKLGRFVCECRRHRWVQACVCVGLISTYQQNQQFEPVVWVTAWHSFDSIVRFLRLWSNGIL